MDLLQNHLKELLDTIHQIHLQHLQNYQQISLHQQQAVLQQTLSNDSESTNNVNQELPQQVKATSNQDNQLIAKLEELLQALIQVII